MVFGLCYFHSLFFVFVFVFSSPLKHTNRPLHTQSQSMCWHVWTLNKYKSDQQWKYIVCRSKKPSVILCSIETNTRTHCSLSPYSTVLEFFSYCSYKSICMISNELETHLSAFVASIWLNPFTLFPLFSFFFHSSFCMSRRNCDCDGCCLVCCLFEFGTLIVYVEFILSP